MSISPLRLIVKGFVFFKNYILYIQIRYMSGIIESVPYVNYSINYKVFKTSVVRIGRNFKAVSTFSFNPLCKGLPNNIFVNRNAKLVIGDNFGISSSTIWCHTEILIGNNVNVGSGCTILDSDCHSLNYRFRGTSLDAKNTTSLPINIGNNVFIGMNCIILKGVCIGDNCVIGAGSVVSKSIPSNSIVAGNPAQVINKIDE